MGRGKTGYLDLAMIISSKIRRISFVLCQRFNETVTVKKKLNQNSCEWLWNRKGEKISVFAFVSRLLKNSVVNIFIARRFFFLFSSFLFVFFSKIKRVKWRHFSASNQLNNHMLVVFIPFISFPFTLAWSIYLSIYVNIFGNV